ncbi:MAG: hypothetical protein IPP29_20815 [Bacteroidetes bacterium]|nr:hypothetical protein [Bacteroidota bacterium]
MNPTGGAGGYTLIAGQSPGNTTNTGHKHPAGVYYVTITMVQAAASFIALW